jgi:hypothetical protein
MGEFLGELLIELVIAPVFNFLLALLWLVLRTTTLVVLYPVLLLTGWLRLWLRERGRQSLAALWRMHKPQGLHRFGWQEAVLDLHYFLATLLIVMAGVGIGLLLYYTTLHLNL